MSCPDETVDGNTVAVFAFLIKNIPKFLIIIISFFSIPIAT